MTWVYVQIPCLGGTFALPVVLAMLHISQPSWGIFGIVARIAGLALTVGAYLLFRGAKAALGAGLVATPKPVAGATLQENGVFGLVRHPIYSAIIAFLIGWALVWNSVASLLCAVGCGVFFVAKSRYEERLLRQYFPGYERYAERVPAFLPVRRR